MAVRSRFFHRPGEGDSSHRNHATKLNLKRLKSGNSSRARPGTLPQRPEEGCESCNAGTSTAGVPPPPRCRSRYFTDDEYDPSVDYESRYFLRAAPVAAALDFVPPRSPHRLLEESLYHDPWALLVSTIFLNVTSCRSARNKIFHFLLTFRDAGAVAATRPEHLERYFEGLGLARTRAEQVWRMSVEYSSDERGRRRRRSVRELYGVGEYGESAYRMFCVGDFGFVPSDRYLRLYREWYLRVGRYGDG